MPLLPNLGDIPQEQFDRIVAAFPGATGAEKAAAYRRWLTNRLIERVRQSEMARIEAAADAARTNAITSMEQALAQSLPAKAEEPPLA